MSDVESTPITARVPQQRREAVPPPVVVPVPDVVREFRLVHDAMRHSVDLLARATATLPSGPSARARELGRFVDALVVFIHHHHTGEDEHWWPSLRERAQAAGQVLAPLTDDHHELDPLLDGMRAHAVALKAGTHQLDALVGDAGALRDHLVEHLAAEEPVLFPLLTTHLEQAEADRLGRVMAKSAPRSGLSYLLGAMDAAASEQDQAVILRKMPAPIRWLRPLMLRRYAKRTALLLGS